MKPHEINEAIGRAIGATPRLSYGVGKDNWTCFTADLKRVCTEWLDEQKRNSYRYSDCVVREFQAWPNYHADLNACHEMEGTLKIDEQYNYIERLECFNPDLPHQFSLAHATAAQRCEAFLRVKGLWKEDANG